MKDMMTNITKNNIVKAIHIQEGLKIYCEGQRSCLNLETQLNKLGIKTRVGCNEVGMWSIYIISVPKELDGTQKKIDW